MKKIAIVGSGIAGLSCAYRLKDSAHLTVFDKNNYVGGHTNTIDLNPIAGASVSFDTGFMVFNHVTYPNLLNCFNALGVATEKTQMSFSVHNAFDNIVWNGAGLNKLFGQRKNLLNPRFYGFVAAVNRFNQLASSMGQSPQGSSQTVAEFVESEKLGQDFLDWYMVPMSGAIWSIAPDKVMNFPIETLARFFYNHGFLGLDTHHQWYTVKGGARHYVDLMRKAMPGVDFMTSRPVSAVRMEGAQGVAVYLQDEMVPQYFDQVVMAVHADEALRLLESPSSLEHKLLSCFEYEYNHTIIHSDESVMPSVKRCWGAWNVRTDDYNGERINSTHYWMNCLQHLAQSPFYAVSLNAKHLVDPAKIHREIDYHHPRFTLPAVQAQKRLHEINQQGESQGIFFCGSYFKYGFHEDAYTSGYNLANQFLQ